MSQRRKRGISARVQHQVHDVARFINTCPHSPSNLEIANRFGKSKSWANYRREIAIQQGLVVRKTKRLSRGCPPLEF